MQKIKLIDLEPRFLIPDESGMRLKIATSLAYAKGIMFLCPQCFRANNYSNVGVHMIRCWDPSVSQDIPPTPGRWFMVGTDFNDLSLQGQISSSVMLTDGCQAHFYIREGMIEFC